MADILIRGMEMPENCTECPCFSQWDDCGINHEWKFADEFDKTKDRLPSCPLVPLPAGHGRLIDANALLDQIRDGYEKAIVWMERAMMQTSDDLGTRPRAEATVVAFWECGAKVKMAPTIVPAEGGIKI